MRILCLDLGLYDPGSYYYRWLVPGIEAAGHQLVAADASGLASLLGPAAMQEVILDYVRAYRIDTLLVMHYRMLEPGCLLTMKAMGVRIVSFHYDDANNGFVWPGGPRVPPEGLSRFLTLDHHADLSLTTFRLAPHAYAGAGFGGMQYATLPIAWQAYPVSSAPLVPIASFCGIPKAPDCFRVRALRALKEAGLPLAIYGRGWEVAPDLVDVSHGEISTDAMLNVFATSAVNLCLPGSRLEPPVPMLKLRNLEVAACGGFQLTDHCAELADYLDPDNDVATFHDIPELIAQVRHWLAVPEAGRELGRRTRQRCEAQWGWDRWWERAAELAEAKGVPLAMDHQPVEPEGPAATRLAGWATALAHCYEASGNKDMARALFREVLRYRPHDFAANSGLGRLLPSAKEAEGFWRRASQHAPDVESMGITTGLPQMGTSAHAENWKRVAAHNWQVAASYANDMEAMVAATAVIASVDPDLAVGTAENLLTKGFAAQALRILDAVIGAFPNIASGYTLRSQALIQERQYDRARTDIQKARSLLLQPQTFYPLA